MNLRNAGFAQSSLNEIENFPQPYYIQTIFNFLLSTLFYRCKMNYFIAKITLVDYFSRMNCFIIPSLKSYSILVLSPIQNVIELLFHLFSMSNITMNWPQVEF